MFCSTIIPTIGRSTLSRAVESVLNQNMDPADFEVIVVNDSGQLLPDAAWHHSTQVQIIHTNCHNRSVARNTGASLAQGKYLHFLDDDDWLLPNAFVALQALAQVSQAAWLYGGFCLVDNNGQAIQVIKPKEGGNCSIQLLASEWLPLQASLIQSTAFFAVGGFASLPSLLGGYEDIDLSRQIGQAHDISGTKVIVANIRIGDNNSTTNYNNMFDQNRQSREKILNAPGTFTRLQASANSSENNSDYWCGQIVYYYLASMRWNLRYKRLLTAASRGIYALIGLALARQYLLSLSFWQGVTEPHLNRVRTAIETSNVSLYTETVWEP